MNYNTVFISILIGCFYNHAYAENNLAEPLAEGALINTYEIDPYGEGVPISSEVVAGRNASEKALLDGSNTFMGDLVSGPVDLEFSNFDLLYGRYVLTDSQKSRLMELAGFGSVGVKLTSSEPFAAMDCREAALELVDDLARYGIAETVSRVFCNGNDDQLIMDTTFQYNPISYAYDLDYSVDEQIGTKRVRVGWRCTDWFFLKDICLKKTGVYENRPVYEEVTYRYDRKRYTDWSIDVTGTSSTQEAKGVRKEFWSVFEMERGLVPVGVGGLTIFVEADVKVSEPWGSPVVNESIESQDVAFLSGRRFYIQCGTYTLFDELDHFTSDRVTMDLDEEFETECIDEDVVYRFENMRNNLNNTTKVEFSPQLTATTPTEYIGTYAGKVEKKLIDATSDFLFYHGLYNPTLMGNPSATTSSNVAAYMNSAQQFSYDLRSQLDAYAIESDLTAGDISDLFFADIYEVQAWSQSDQAVVNIGIDLDDLGFMVGVYKGAVATTQPEWFNDFKSWFFNESERAGTEISPVFAVEAIQDATRYALDPEGLNVHYAFGCKYLESWSHLTRTYVTAERFMFLMGDLYSSDENLPPAYLALFADNPDKQGAAESLYESHTGLVQSELNTSANRLSQVGISSIPTWSPEARNTMCPFQTGGGFSD